MDDYFKAVKQIIDQDNIKIVSFDLFDTLFVRPALSGDNILHIGDSHKADYIAPKSKGLKTFFIPKNTVLFREYFNANKLLNNLGDDIYGNIIIGFAINQLLEHPEETGVNFTLQTYIHLIIFPMLLHTSLFLLNEPDIQKNKKYRKLYFASRDGYLTKKAYDLLCPFFESKLGSCYLLTSRIACRTMIEDSFFERLHARFIPKDCTLAEFVTATVTDSSLRELILLELDDESLNTLVRSKTQQCITLLSHYAEALENYHNEKKQATFAYYSDMFEDATSVLMVDCGFCGTISAYLTRAFHGDRKFDKAFFWENEKNQMLDDINGTKTYTAFSSKKGHLLGPQVESMFSEISGSCLGFSLSQNGTPIPFFENNWQPEEMKSDILFVQQYALDLIQKFCDTFEVSLPLLMPTNLQIVMDFILHFLSGSNLNTPTIFHNILFKESYSSKITSKSLSELIICRNTKGE